MNQTNETNETNPQSGHVRPPLNLPDFVNLAGPNGEVVLVPRFMVPATAVQLEGARRADEMPLDEATDGVGF